MAAESLYDHAGGDEGLHRLEVLFYDKALADPVLRSVFTLEALDEAGLNWRWPQ